VYYGTSPSSIVVISRSDVASTVSRKRFQSRYRHLLHIQPQLASLVLLPSRIQLLHLEILFIARGNTRVFRTGSQDLYINNIGLHVLERNRGRGRKKRGKWSALYLLLGLFMAYFRADLCPYGTLATSARGRSACTATSTMFPASPSLMVFLLTVAS